MIFNAEVNVFLLPYDVPWSTGLVSTLWSVCLSENELMQMGAHRGECPTVQFAVSILLGMAAAGCMAGPVLAQWLWFIANWSKDEHYPRAVSSLRLRPELQSIFQFSSIIGSY